MAITTYAELQTAIANWLDHTDLTDRIPEFIALAEEGIQSDVIHWRGEKRADLTVDSRFEDVPTDFLEPRRIQISATKTPLRPISVDDMQGLRGNAENVAGTPTTYAIVGAEIEFYPTPDEAYTADFYYKASVPALADDNASNWVLANAPSIYLYGALIQAAPFLIEDQRLATWGQLYSQAIGRFNLAGKRGKHGGTGKRMTIR